MDFPRFIDISPFLFNLTLSAFSLAGQPDLLEPQDGVKNRMPEAKSKRRNQERSGRNERWGIIFRQFQEAKFNYLGPKRPGKGEIMPFFHTIGQNPC